MDRIKYEVYHQLWRWWHLRLTKLFDDLNPRPGYKTDGGYHGWACGIRSRPRWHLCCNGNPGGWRTAVCDFLEHRWRDTDHCNPERWKPGMGG